MNAILNIARLHITLQLQNPGTYIQYFAVPVVMMLILGLAISEDPAELHLDVLDEDNSAISTEFIQAIENTEGETVIKICRYGASNPESCGLDNNDAYAEVGETRLKDGETAAILIIPADFEEKLQAGQPAEITYQSNDQLNAPTIARTTVDAAISKVGGSMVIARIGTQTAESVFGEVETGDFKQLQATAQSGLQNPPARLVTESTGGAVNPGGTGQSVPGMGSMFVLFSLTALAINLVLEREQGTLQRLFTLPAPKSAIVMGKVLGAFFFGVLQFFVFILVGMLMAVDWGNNYLAIVLLVLAYCFAGTALGFLMATFVRTSDQAGGISTLVVLTLAPLGGAWWPLEIVPEAMQTFGHISPVAWVMDGFNDLIFDNKGLVDILPEVGVLVGMGMVLLVIGIWRFRYE